MVCWVAWGSLHQHATAHQPFRTPVLARAACKLLSPWTRVNLWEGDKHFQQNPAAKDKSKRNCCVLAQKLLELIFFVALQEEKQTWDLQIFTALTLLEKSLSFPLLLGIFFCSPNHCRFRLIWRMASEIHCFSSFSNDSQGFDTKPVWLKSGPVASLKIFLNLSTIPGWSSNLKSKPRSGKICKF